MKVKSVVVGSMAGGRDRLGALERRIVEQRESRLSYKTMLSWVQLASVSERPDCVAGKHPLVRRSKRCD